MTDRLPVLAAIPELRAALERIGAAVLVAPPGAGKTTAAPLALLEELWAANGRLILLEPRRIAARAAARRMASVLGEAVGATVGYRVRMDAHVSAKTRLEVVTEGVFTRMILEDPGLDGVAGVLFDEFHERSLDADLGLALAIEARGLLRPDLRVVVMSATLDGARVASLLSEAPLIESRGRAFEVETRYRPRQPADRLETHAARTIRAALQETGAGDVLVFLPGQREIRAVAAELAGATQGQGDVRVTPLYGGLAPADQDLAITPAPPGVRKVILSTSIAETSLTIEGVRVVVDSGLSRAPRYDPARGLTRLETIRSSLASADQRRGRAGRTAPGVCYRLWAEAETRGLDPHGRPEILDADLTGLALDLARWGARSPDGLAFLDPPGVGAFAAARAALARLGALDPDGALTAHGEALARLPLPPRLGHMVLAATAYGAGRRAALIAALLSEPNLAGRAVDLSTRLSRLLRAREGPERAARDMAGRWAELAEAAAGRSGPGGGPPPDGVLLGWAFPERLARARGRPGEFLLASGRGAALDPAEPLSTSEWIAVGELGGGAARDRILSAVALDAGDVETWFADQLLTEDVVEAADNGRLAALRVRRLGQIRLGSVRLEGREAGPAIQSALLARLSPDAIAALPWSQESRSMRARLVFLAARDGEGWPDASDAALAADAANWLAPLLDTRRSLAELTPGDLHAALIGAVGWDAARRADVAAPPAWIAPTGTRTPIDYAAEGGPRIEIRVQELFGVTAHPTLPDGRTRLVLSLLSPARRPIQTTRDLPAFWSGSWSDVRKDMRGRYPKHPWPDDPASAEATRRAKPRP